MLYGRRIIEPHITHIKKSSPSLLVNKNFQYKYCWYFLTAITGGCLLFLAPAFYFLSQNYDIFRNLAFDTQPALIDHLERELSWMRTFFILGLGSIGGLVLFLSLRVTRQLLTPIAAIEKHMYQVSAGKLHTHSFYLDENSDFKDLSHTYEYLCKSLQEKSLAELALLKKIQIDPQDRDSYAIWSQLINEKNATLGLKEELPTNENVVSWSEFDQKRRAS